jgi:hypothetical protein
MPPVMCRLDSRARAEQAFSLRATGATWQHIADLLGYRTRSAARIAVVRHLDRTPADTPETARRRAEESLRILQATLFGRLAEAVQNGETDNLVMLSRELRNTTAEAAKLVGAYAPAAVAVEVNVRQSASAILDRAEADLLELAARRPDRPAAAAEVIDAEVVGL